MGDADTELGGPRRDFPSTCWSRVLGGPLDGSGAGIEALARTYWKPVYAVIRSRWAKSNEDAKDLTQDFFAWIQESGFLSKADPARGRFRGFVKAALKSWLSTEQRDAGRLKRGGGRRILSLDIKDSDLPGADPVDPASRAPEDLLDDAWRNELVARAEEALRKELEGEARGLTFRIFRDYYLRESADVDYRAVAARHGVAEPEVQNHLRYAKKRYRAHLKELVAETVAGDEDLAAEWAALFGPEPA